jgi:anti-anti-sigma factor
METLVNVNKKEENWIIIFNISGELDETNADKTFTGIYKEIGDFNDKKIILNLEGLKYLNSKSIWYIADIFSNIEEADSKMYISNCDESVKDVLELVWITTIVPTVETEEEAIKELS